MGDPPRARLAGYAPGASHAWRRVRASSWQRKSGARRSTDSASREKSFHRGVGDVAYSRSHAPGEREGPAER